MINEKGENISSAEEDTLRWLATKKAQCNDAFLPLLFDTHRYLVLKGGGGSGKSIFAGQKLIERATTEKGHRFLVCRKVAQTLRNSCFRQLCAQAREMYPEEIDCIPRGQSGDMYLRFRNGSEILFSGLDDAEKLKSIYNITGIWIEEASEITEGDFNQLDIRMRGKTRWYQQIILSFNPISMQHWLKKRFFDRFDERARVHESTYRDNRFLDNEAIRTLESFRDTDEYYYSVYCLGMWGVSGKTVFDGKALSERLQALTPPKETGLFTYTDDGKKIGEIAFLQSESGCVRIYEKPQDGIPYVIGADTAGDGSDSFVGQVLNNCTGEQVAVLRGNFDEDVFARQLYCLGLYYNTALIGVEVNFSTYTVMELERLRYPKQYVRQSVDDYTHAMRRAYGFRTDSKTRPVILAQLIKVVRQHPESIRDRTTIEEMLSFVREEQTLRPQAEAGAHDDTVMALAIAHFVREQQSYLPEKKKTQRSWTKSMLQDYKNASADERAYLREIWGSPKESSNTKEAEDGE